MHWQDDYRPSWNKGSTATTVSLGGERVHYAGGRFMAATREFEHPEDKVTWRTSKDTILRFRKDRRRFPVPAYERHNLL